MKSVKKEKGLFKSFWQAGYECADHLNHQQIRVNLHKEISHDKLVEEDYNHLQQFNINTVREGICWSEVDKGHGIYDWDEVIQRINVGRRLGIQQIWDICHFGFPDNVSPLDSDFTQRFTDVCKAFAKLWKSLSDNTLIVTPINEIGFLAWFGGEAKETVPYTHGKESEVKYQLVKASISGMKAMREILPTVRFLQTEPLVWVFPADNNLKTIREVEDINFNKLEVLDMLAGKRCPELGGDASLLDIIGLDFYPYNEWIHWGPRLEWKNRSNEKWKPLSELLKHVQQRYNRPIVLSETSHVEVERGSWILNVAQECKKAIDSGVELLGICLYPIIDRPDWNNLNHYYFAGMWDLDVKGSKPYKRVLCEEYSEALQKAQIILPENDLPETQTSAA